MKHEERLTQWVADGASLILDNPRNVEEAKEQLQDKFKLACIKLATLEDKIENGELVEVSKNAVVLIPEERAKEMRLCNEERTQAVGEFVERLKKELFAKCTYILTVDNPNDYDMKSDEVNALIDELAKEVCGE